MRRLSSFLLGSVSRRLNRKETRSPPRLGRQTYLNINRSLSSKTTSVEKSHVQYDSPCRSFQFLSSNQRYAHSSSLREETGYQNQTKMEVEIISKQFIKPTTPTPKHLRTYELSFPDQIFPNYYTPFVYFYPNTTAHQNHDDNNEDLILKKRQVLKQSLSETLTRFYVLAGRVKDSRHIDCNDEGIYYVEAKISDLTMSDFLKHPDNKSIHRLLPVDPHSEEELLSRNDIAIIQVTAFGCGGISIVLNTTHKIMDADSNTTFFNAWATAAREAPDSELQINPVFISSSFFPSNPALPQDAKSWFFPRVAPNKVATRRFLFCASSLADLKQKAESSSRVLSVTALIWKCANAAYKAPSNSSLIIALGLRNRYSPPAPPHSIGNIVTVTDPIQYCSQIDKDLRLDSVAKQLKIGANKFTSEFLVKWKEDLITNGEAKLNEMKMWYDSNKDGKHMIVTSLCRGGTYEVADFGWGKPIWVCLGNGDSKLQYCENFAILMDTRCGTGIEAWVTLTEQDMKVFEQDSELLAFANMIASPLN